MPPSIDLPSAHRHFSTHCFNGAWDLIDKPSRTPEEERRMVALCHASIYHWLCRPDCTDQNLSIGYWQASRIETLLGHADQARRWAEVCLEYSHDLAPFYLGYAYEALARAALATGNVDQANQHIAEARRLASQVGEQEEREMLLRDLAELDR